MLQVSIDLGFELACIMVQYKGLGNRHACVAVQYRFSLSLIVYK